MLWNSLFQVLVCVYDVRFQHKEVCEVLHVYILRNIYAPVVQSKIVGISDLHHPWEPVTNIDASDGDGVSIWIGRSRLLTNFKHHLQLTLKGLLTTNVISFYFVICWNVRESKEGKDWELIQSSTTSDLGQHMGKWQNPKKTSDTIESRGQPFPGSGLQSCKEQTRQLDKSKYKTQTTKRTHKRSITSEWLVQNYCGLKQD